MRKLFEEYIESADYKISVFFKELETQIEKWFTNGSLAAQGCQLDGDIDISNYNPMEKFLTFNFIESGVTVKQVDEEDYLTFYKYRVIFMIRLDQMKGTEAPAASPAEGEETPVETPVEGKALDINKILLKIHQFDEDNKEMGELVEEIDVTDIKEDFLIDKLGQLKDKSEDAGETNGEDLKDNIYVK